MPIILDVVGFSASATSASDTLNALAVAAGTAQQGPTSYYRADTIEDLIGQLYVVSAGLAPCRFDLDDRPAPGELVVHLDQTIVAACTDGASCDAGYTYDEGAGVVELHGTSCAAIRDGQCHDVWFDTSASP